MKTDESDIAPIIEALRSAKSRSPFVPLFRLKFPDEFDPVGTRVLPAIPQSRECEQLPIVDFEVTRFSLGQKSSPHHSSEAT
jgi:hypothetical protein